MTDFIQNDILAIDRLCPTLDFDSLVRLIPPGSIPIQMIATKLLILVPYGEKP